MSGTIIAIGAIIAFFWVMWPQIKNTIGNTWNSVSNEGATTCGEQQYWDGHKCVSAK